MYKDRVAPWTQRFADTRTHYGHKGSLIDTKTRYALSQVFTDILLIRTQRITDMTRTHSVACKNSPDMSE